MTLISSMHNPAGPLSSWELPGSLDSSRDKVHLCSAPTDLVDIFSQHTASKAASGSDTLPGTPVSGGTYSGTIRLHKDFHSAALDNNRDVLVYLPPGYEENKDKHYPVLYLADGQNVFNRETSFGGVEWGVDEAAERLMRQGKIKDIIIVAVNNTPDRMDEYTHVPDPHHGGGNLDTYAKFLTEELKPYINSQYRSLTDAGNTGIMGSSLGGLSALYLGWNYPGTFALVGALSPSLWWAGKDIIGRIAGDTRTAGPEKIWLDFGWKESQLDEDQNGIPDSLENARAMKEVLKEKGYFPGDDLFYFEDPEGGHNEWSWARRVDMVLLSLFPVEDYLVSPMGIKAAQ